MRALLSAPMYHSAPNSFAMAVAQNDGLLVLEERFDAEAHAGADRAARASATPTWCRRCMCACCALPDAVRQRHDLSSLRFVSSTGSPCPPEVKRAMIDWWGPVIHEAYGSSELSYMTLLDQRAGAAQAGLGRAAAARRRAAHPRRRRQREAARRGRPDLRQARSAGRFQLQPRRLGARARWSATAT